MPKPELVEVTLPPYCIHSEYAVIGALLRENSAYDRIADLLAETDFYTHRHKIIFAKIMALIESGKPADVITVNEALGGENDDLAYLGQIAYNTPGAANIREYAKAVRDARIARDLITAANRMTELAHSHGNIHERLEEAQALVGDLQEGSLNDEPVLLREVLSKVVEDIDDRYHGRKEITGLTTSFIDLDTKTAGLQKGDLIIIAGRPSMGKTALALQIGQEAALNEARVLVFSLEMTDRGLVERALANVGRISSHALRTGKLQDADWPRITAAVGRLGEAALFIDKTSAPTVANMRAKSRRIKRKYGLDLVIVDYIQLMGGNGGDNRNDVVAGITRGLKLMAKDLDVPVIAISQLSRKVEERTDKRPIMSDLRESGAIEQDADVILFVYRDEYYTKEKCLNPNVAELLIAKQRMGATGDVYLTWSGDHCRFDNHAGHYRRPDNVRQIMPKQID